MTREELSTLGIKVERNISAYSLLSENAEQILMDEGVALTPGVRKRISLLRKLHSEFLESPERTNGKPITNSDDAHKILRPVFVGKNHEECVAIMTNRANRLIEVFKVSSGGLYATTIDARTIAKRALEVNAAGVILSHNHPSGNLKPGNHDIEATRNVRKALGSTCTTIS